MTLTTRQWQSARPLLSTTHQPGNVNIDTINPCLICRIATDSTQLWAHLLLGKGQHIKIVLSLRISLFYLTNTKYGLPFLFGIFPYTASASRLKYLYRGALSLRPDHDVLCVRVCFANSSNKIHCVLYMYCIWSA